MRKDVGQRGNNEFVFRIPHMYTQYCSKYKNPAVPVQAVPNKMGFTAVLFKTDLYENVLQLLQSVLMRVIKKLRFEIC
jgi:hypothetical protein